MAEDSNKRMKIGVQLPEVEWEVPFPELIEMAQAAETVGFDSVWYGDHLIYDLPVGARGPWEAWTTLAAIAASTSTIELGPLVASTSFHAPAMLAKQAATVDAISEGRLIVGLGAGWNQREYDAFGFPYDRRVSRFAEAFTIIRTLLRDGEIDFHGDYYSADRCVLHPRSPRPGGPPLMIGSVGARMLDLTLPYVDSWNMWWSQYGNTAAGFAKEKTRVDALIEAAGRLSGSVEATAAVHVRLEGGAGRQMGNYVGDLAIEPLTGSPAELADQLREWEYAGAAHVQLCVDPITRASIESLGDVLVEFRS
ncbi:MAG: LLM class flavin-dependent oxidoreductase [Acidimicrobiaceae bacterium]|jgi:alkanesulfonate monooxygenase SsuD/methylene tetrahydromethanopterin reductase-like flavin-dependent oxidoreductase (luciferase family)|nr:LLM class flavin-dependent oxidoreductase [Acidimicrobiaceae bacterium]MBT5850693.1 LLM class flavin-dependent oxidoreductase [Acidimicrobiaceae bacterium]